jgi:RNA polymerase sigma factor (sigma-70 family)
MSAGAIFDPDAEAQLVRRIIARDARSMDDLARHMASIPRFLEAKNQELGRPLDTEELRDLEQDAKLIVLRDLPAYRPVAPLQAWIRGICRNCLRAAVRARRRRARRFAPFWEDLSAVAAGDEFRDWSEVELLLERLGGTEAQIVRWRHLFDLSFQEIGETLGCPANTVKARYYRGLERLRRQLVGGDQP